MAIENEESGSVQQGRQIHITVDSLTITIPSASVTLVVTQRELDTTTPQPDSGEQPAGRVAPLDSRALRQYIDDLNLGSGIKEARELARAQLVQRALDEWNYLRGPLEEALFHPRSREQLEKLAQQYPDYVIFTRRQGTLLLCQDKYVKMLRGRKAIKSLAYNLAAERAGLVTHEAIEWDSMKRAWLAHRKTPGLY